MILHAYKGIYNGPGGDYKSDIARVGVGILKWLTTYLSYFTLNYLMFEL